METDVWDLWSPDNSDQYALTQDLARMADDVDEALTSLKTEVTRRVFAHAGKTNGTQSMSGGAVATVSLQVSEGGFTLVNNALVIPETAVYRVAAQCYFTGTLQATAVGHIRRNGNSFITTRSYKESGQDVSGFVSVIVLLNAGDRMDIWSNFGNATFGSTGYDGLFIEAEKIS